MQVSSVEQEVRQFYVECVLSVRGRHDEIWNGGVWAVPTCFLQFYQVFNEN